MTEPVQGLVGPASTTSLGVGTTPILRAGQLGELIVQELHGRYYETNYRSNMFYAATTAVVTTTVGLATTYTGLCLSNPVNSTVNLVIDQASMMQSVIQSTQVEAYALATGFNGSTNVTHTTPVTPKSCLVGSSAVPNALADVSATLPTAPLYTMFITNTGTATADSTGNQVVDIGGSIILKPGAYICWVTPAQASVAGMWFSFHWEEVPV